MADRFTLAVRSLPVRAVYTPPSDPFRSDRKFLIALPNDILLGVIGSGRVSVELYRSASPRSSDVFSRQHRLERVGTRQVEPGEVIALRAGHDVVDFWAVDADAVIVELALLKADRIVWNYDAETLQAAFASSASVDATRVEYAIELFQLLRYADAVPNLLHLVREHGHHGVRWKAVKAILHLDLAQGISALRIAVDDPHEHVRNAARATLRNLTEAKLVEEAECHGA